MVDIFLMKSLLRALVPGMRLILVGDAPSCALPRVQSVQPIKYPDLPSQNSELLFVSLLSFLFRVLR